MSHEARRGLTITASLSGIIALIIAFYQASIWAGSLASEQDIQKLERRVKVVETQFDTIIDNQRYMRGRLDSIADSRD